MRQMTEMSQRKKKQPEEARFPRCELHFLSSAHNFCPARSSEKRK